MRLLFLAVALLLLSACSRQENVKIDGRISPATMVFAFPGKQVLTPDASYAIISDSSLDTLYNAWKKQLFSKGISAWDPTFDCNRFAQSFAAFVQEHHFSASFRQANAAEAVAIGEVWYTSNSQGKHAVNVILLARGFVFFEPQSGKIIAFDRKEYESIQLIKF